MDIKDFDALWTKGRETDLTVVKDLWNGRADSYSKSSFETSRAQAKEQELEMLMEKGMLTPDSSVLDVGCGPGRYAVLLGARAKEVLGVDISERMLAIAAENVKNAGLSNVSFRNLAWDEAELEREGFEGRFDLVFASRCPGVHNYATLKKLCEASRKSCFLSTFATRTDLVRGELERRLGRVDQDRREGSVYYIFNILWLMGYRPEITYVANNWVNTYSMEEAQNEYFAIFEPRAEDREDTRRIIREHLEEIQENGVVTERVESKVAWITWNVN